MKVIAVTGHRPGGLFDGYPYTLKNDMLLLSFCKRLMEKLQRENSEMTIRTGMALGFDIAVAEACSSLKIPFEAWVPFANQDLRWPDESKDRYRLFLGEAETIHIVSEGPYKHEFMQIRNEAMIRDADEVASLWNKKPSGGTHNAILYAQKMGIPINNYWEAWEKMKKNA